MAALSALALATPALVRAEKAAGAALPDEARQVEPNRFRIDKNYDDTLKFYKVVYPPAKYPRKAIVNQPGIKAVHIDNPEVRPGGWEGLNVYELNGETRVFVLVAPREKEKEKEKKGRKK
jgi:hypothetical protein